MNPTTTPTTTPTIPPLANATTPTTVNQTGGFNIQVPNTIPSNMLAGTNTRQSIADYRNQLQSRFDQSQAQQQSLQQQIVAQGVPGTQEAQAKQTLLDLQQGLRQGLVNTENKPIAMQFITGQQAAMQKQGSLDILAASENLQALSGQRASLLDNLKTQLGFTQKNYEDYLGLNKEFRSIDKEQRDTARQTLADIIQFGEGKSYDQLDPESKQQIINAVADSPLSLGLVKTAMARGKVAYDEARAKAAQSLRGSTGAAGALQGLSPAVQTKFYGLLDDFDKQTATQRTIVTSAENIKALSERAKTEPTAQVGLVYQYMKSLDPNSTVREGEYATAKNTTGAAGKIANTYNKIVKGKFLNEDQINSFVADAERLAKESEKQITTRAAEFDRRSSLIGIPQGLFYQSAVVPQQQDVQVQPVQGTVIQYQGKTYSVDANGDLTPL